MLSVEILKFVILLIFFIWITLLSCFELYYKISTNNTDLLHTFEEINSNNKVILSHLTKNQSKQEIFIPLEIEFEIELSTINKTKQNVTNINWLKYDKTYNKNITCDFFSLLRKECLPSF